MILADSVLADQDPGLSAHWGGQGMIPVPMYSRLLEVKHSLLVTSLSPPPAFAVFRYKTLQGSRGAERLTDIASNRTGI